MNRPAITVYTKNSCPQCRATERKLAKEGLVFHEINIDDHPEIGEKLIAEGYTAAPVVKLANGESWTGFRPDLILALAKDGLQ